MTLPRVTIVIPALNMEDWVTETLLSAIGQTLAKDELEIILVDDGSVDNTAAVADDLLSRSDVSYEILNCGETRGLSAARNAGWRRARGEWVQFLDADDLLETDEISTALPMSEQVGPEVASIFCSWGRLILEGSEWVRRPVCPSPTVGADPLAEMLRPDICINNNGCHIFRRSWLERVGGYDETYPLFEDINLLMRIVMAGGVLKWAPSMRPLFWYRKRQGSISHGGHRKFVDACVRITYLAEDYWRETGMLTEAHTEALARSYFVSARYFAEHDPASFERIVTHIFELLPSFVPPEPTALRRLTKVVGYRRAERVAVSYRRAKRLRLWRQPP